MPTIDDSQRARLVSLLWSLKRAIADAPEGAVPGLRYVHFNALLREERYREEVISQCLLSDSEEVRHLAAEIRELRLPDAVIGSRRPVDSEPPEEPAAEAPGPSAVPPPSRPATDSRLAGAVRVGGLLAAVGVLAAVLVGLGRGFLAATRVVEVSGSLPRDTLWRTGERYHLKDMVYVESGATLTIEPGVQITGGPGSALIVTRDADINARGTREAPIVFTSAKPPGQRARGDWGGVVLLGNAPVNTGVGHVEGIDRADPRGAFGGSDSNESCGILQYIRIEFAGHEISADNELNGLTLGGCGAGTVLRNLQVHMGLDDGVELFGGSANLSHVLISRAGDDGLDWDRGWTGQGQFIIVLQDGDKGDSAIEADNYKKDNGAEPRSAPTLSNLTLLSSGNPGIAQRGMTLREGTGGDLRNVLVAGFTLGAIDVRGAATVAQIEKGGLRISGLVLTDPVGDWFEAESGEKDDDGGFDEAAWIRTVEGATFREHGLLDPDTADPRGPRLVPRDDPILRTAAVPLPQGEFWDEAANFAGAVRPGSRGSWLDGWAAFPSD